MFNAFLLNLIALLLYALIIVQAGVGYTLLAILFLSIIFVFIITTFFYPKQQQQLSGQQQSEPQDQINLITNSNENHIIFNKENKLNNFNDILILQKSYEMRNSRLLMLNDYINDKYHDLNGHGFGYIIIKSDVNVIDDNNNNKNELQLGDIISQIDDNDSDIAIFSNDAEVVLNDYDRTNIADININLFVDQILNHAINNIQEQELSMYINSNDNNDNDDNNNNEINSKNLQLSTNDEIKAYIDSLVRDAITHIGQTSTYKDHVSSSVTDELYSTNANDISISPQIERGGEGASSSSSSSTNFELLIDQVKDHISNTINIKKTEGRKNTMNVNDNAKNDNKNDDDDDDDDKCEVPSPAIIMYEVKSAISSLLQDRNKFKRKLPLETKPTKGINRKGKTRRRLESSEKSTINIDNNYNNSNVTNPLFLKHNILSSSDNVLLSPMIINNEIVRYKNNFNNFYKYSGRYRSRMIRMKILAKKRLNKNNNSNNIPHIIFPSIDENEENEIDDDNKNDFYHQHLGPGRSLIYNNNNINNKGNDDIDNYLPWFLLTSDHHHKSHHQQQHQPLHHDMFHHHHQSKPMTTLQVLTLSSSSSSYSPLPLQRRSSKIYDSPKMIHVDHIQQQLSGQQQQQQQYSSTNVLEQTLLKKTKINTISTLRHTMLRKSLIKKEINNKSNSYYNNDNNNNNQNYYNIHKEKINLPQYLLEIEQSEKLPSVDILSLPEHVIIASELSINQIITNIQMVVHNDYNENDNNNNNNNDNNVSKSD